MTLACVALSDIGGSQGHGVRERAIRVKMESLRVRNNVYRGLKKNSSLPQNCVLEAEMEIKGEEQAQKYDQFI